MRVIIYGAGGIGGVIPRFYPESVCGGGRLRTLAAVGYKDRHSGKLTGVPGKSNGYSRTYARGDTPDQGRD